MKKEINTLKSFRNYNKFYKEKDFNLTITIDNEVIFTKTTSLCELAKQFDTTPYKILELNNITNILDLSYGQKLKIKEGLK